MTLQPEFSLEVKATEDAALLAGMLLKVGKWSRQVEKKAHVNLEFGTAGVTPADKGSQREIVKELSSKFPLALFIAEEDTDLPQQTPEAIFEGRELMFGVDPIDGSTEYNRDNASWCVSIGVRQNRIHIGGTISAPDVRDGFHVTGECGRGVWVRDRGTALIQVKPPGERPEKLVISLGLDVLRQNAFNQFVTTLPKQLKPRRIAPSGALELGLVAAGRVDAIVQAPQLPHDWFAGLPLVLESGRKFKGFKIENKKVVWLEKPDLDCYRSDAQVLGFIAGHPAVVDELCPLLELNLG